MTRTIVWLSLLVWGCAPAPPASSASAWRVPAPKAPPPPMAATLPATEPSAPQLPHQPPPQPPPTRIEAAPPSDPRGELATCRIGSEPGLAVALVLDRSGSMTGQPIDELRKGVDHAVGTLAADHRLAIVTFDSRPTVIFPLDVIGTAEAAREAIARITPGGGTEGYPALEAAYGELRQIETKRRHIVFLTDGKMPTNGIRDLVTRVAECGMTVSGVSLGPDTDLELLTMIATVGKGRLIEIADPAKIASALAAELGAIAP